MTKRARGSVRPGQRRPTQRRPSGSSASRPDAAGAAPVTGSPAPRPSGLTEAEERRAAELEAQLLAEERAAEQSRRTRTARVDREVVGTGSLALRAEQEYAYVGRDVKDIVRIAVLLLAILIVLWVVIEGAGVLG